MSIEARELHLYLINKEVFYTSLLSIEKNLFKKINKGVFDDEKAVKAYYNLVTDAAKLYCKEFGGVYFQVFTVKTRKEVCKEFLKNFLED